VLLHNVELRLKAPALLAAFKRMLHRNDYKGWLGKRKPGRERL